MKRLFFIFICAALLTSLCVPALAEPETVTEPTNQSTNTIYRVTGETEFLGNWTPDDRFIMTETATDTYELVLEDLPAGTYLFCITENGGYFWWDNGGTPYRIELEKASTVTIQFTLIDGAGYTQVITDELSPPADPPVKRTLIIQPPDHWLSVEIYTWDPSAFGDFPGVTVTKTNNQYRCSIDASITNLIISGRVDEVCREQTPDIKLENNSKDTVIRIGENNSVVISYGDAIPNTPPPIIKPATSRPNSTVQTTLPTQAVVTTPSVPAETTPTTIVTKPSETEATFQTETVPDDETTPPSPPENTSVPDEETSPPSPSENTSVTDVTPPSEPQPSTSAKPKPNALVNQPIQFMVAFLFGIMAVCMYLLFLLMKNNPFSLEVTSNGQLLRRGHLSKKAVAQAVKENMPEPSHKLDQTIWEEIQKISKSERS